MAFVVIRNDITQVKADAIVNTANPRPLIGNGTDRAIYKAAGEKQLLEARKVIGEIEEGDVAVTAAFNLNAKYIIHAVTPVWVDGEHGELELLHEAYQKSIEAAVKRKCKSIAFPLMAGGSNGYPNNLAVKVALSELTNAGVDHKDLDIKLVLFSDEALEHASGTWKKIKAYIDSAEVESAHAVEYIYKGDYASKAARRRQESLEKLEMRRMRQMQVSADELKAGVKTTGIFTSSCVSAKKKKINIDELKKTIESKEKRTFGSRLIELIDARGMKDSQVYGECMTAQAFANIKYEKSYPSKNNAIVFALALELSMEDTIDLLSLAGYALNLNEPFDYVIHTCIEAKEYNLWNVMDYLQEVGCKIELIKDRKSWLEK